MRGQDLPVGVVNQSTGLLDRQGRTALTLQVMVRSCERRATLSGLAKPMPDKRLGDGFRVALIWLRGQDLNL